MKNGSTVWASTSARHIIDIAIHPNKNWVYAVGQGQDRRPFFIYSTTGGSSWSSRLAGPFSVGDRYFWYKAEATNNFLYLTYGDSGARYLYKIPINNLTGEPSSTNWTTLFSNQQITDMKVVNNELYTLIGSTLYKENTPHLQFNISQYNYANPSSMGLSNSLYGLFGAGDNALLYVNGDLLVTGGYRNATVPTLNRIFTVDNKYAFVGGSLYNSSANLFRYNATGFRQAASGVSTNVSLDNHNIAEMTVNANYYTALSQSIDFYINVTDNDAYWEQVQLGQPHQVTHSGNKVRWKATLRSGSNPEVTPYVDDLTINYRAGKQYTIDKTTVRVN